MSLIRMMVAHFHSPSGGGVAPVIVKSGDYSDADNPTAEVWLQFNTTGLTTHYAPAGGVADYSWLISGSASSYDIRFVKTAGSIDASSYGMANNTWYNLNTNRKMGVLNNDSDFFDLTCTATVDIKYNANSTIISSNTINFYAWGI